MSPDRLSKVFAALADPTRRDILARLSRGTCSVTELAEPHDMSLPAISKHLRVLEQSGLIRRGREAQWRPCRIQAAPLKEAVDWIGQYKRHWEEMQRESWKRLDVELREQHRGDLLQALAYANLAATRRVIVCLAYPCTAESWLSLQERGRLMHRAEMTAGERSLHLWLTAVPMKAAE